MKLTCPMRQKLLIAYPIYLFFFTETALVLFNKSNIFSPSLLSNTGQWDIMGDTVWMMPHKKDNYLEFALLPSFLLSLQADRTLCQSFWMGSHILNLGCTLESPACWSPTPGILIQWDWGLDSNCSKAVQVILMGIQDGSIWGSVWFPVRLKAPEEGQEGSLCCPSVLNPCGVSGSAWGMGGWTNSSELEEATWGPDLRVSGLSWWRRVCYMRLWSVWRWLSLGRSSWKSSLGNRPTRGALNRRLWRHRAPRW